MNSKREMPALDTKAATINLLVVNRRPNKSARASIGGMNMNAETACRCSSSGARCCSLTMHASHNKKQQKFQVSRQAHLHQVKDEAHPLVLASLSPIFSAERIHLIICSDVDSQQIPMPHFASVDIPQTTSVQCAGDCGV
jgi:hypothetical protein